MTVKTGVRKKHGEGICINIDIWVCEWNAEYDIFVVPTITIIPYICNGIREAVLASIRGRGLGYLFYPITEIHFEYHGHIWQVLVAVTPV